MHVALALVSTVGSAEPDSIWPRFMSPLRMTQLLKATVLSRPRRLLPSRLLTLTSGGDPVRVGGITTEGDHSGAQPSSPPRDGSGDRHGQQHWRSSGSGFENAANEAASSSTGPSSAMAGESQCPLRLRRTPWIRGSHGEHNGVVELVSVSRWPGRLQLQGRLQRVTAVAWMELPQTVDTGHQALG